MNRDGWLVLDVGNTHTVAGLYVGGDADRRIAIARFRTDPGCTSDEYRSHLAQLFRDESLWERTERVIYSTVVPALETTVAAALGPLPALSVQASTRRDFDLDLPRPDQLGADRLANVAGAMTLAKPPFLIVDAGTATTFCLIDSRPAYIGGAIAPGLEISWRALQGRAAQLYSVKLDRPRAAIGDTTESQLQSGVLQGTEALLESFTDRLLAEAAKRPSFQSPTLFATGGCLAGLKLSDRFWVEPELTLKGLLRYGQLTQ